MDFNPQDKKLDTSNANYLEIKNVDEKKSTRTDLFVSTMQLHQDKSLQILYDILFSLG